MADAERHDEVDVDDDDEQENLAASISSILVDFCRLVNCVAVVVVVVARDGQLL